MMQKGSLYGDKRGVCTQRGRKLRPGDRAALDGVELRVV